MPHEFTFSGILIPGLLLQLLLVLFGYAGVELMLARIGVFRWVWHPALFRIGLIVAVFSLVGLYVRF
ncbi:DUF1656 domain-containing protein [Mangrovitalea sediminis]|uniref:DUF1656 domain-containing protein n=1 Tax=Mangrovitalea sediminis TaxID=1982043 RepID=UPI000BE58910|nr:DUF1656 domain-containing protein [Mangrovitalea sediminis]